MSLQNDELSETQITAKDLPLEFKVKYLGSFESKGLWGIKHTRRPVDHLVTVAKNLPPNRNLPFCILSVRTDDVQIETMSSGTSSMSNAAFAPIRRWPIDSISYGVQDLVYTRVFAMIVVVQDDQNQNENHFEVHAFVCDSRAMARQLTYALAASFQEYSRKIKEVEESNLKNNNNSIIDSPLKRKFAIDLRTPDELQEEHETEA